MQLRVGDLRICRYGVDNRHLKGAVPYMALALECLQHVGGLIHSTQKRHAAALVDPGHSIIQIVGCLDFHLFQWAMPCSSSMPEAFESVWPEDFLLCNCVGIANVLDGPVARAPAGCFISRNRQYPVMTSQIGFAGVPMPSAANSKAVIRLPCSGLVAQEPFARAAASNNKRPFPDGLLEDQDEVRGMMLTFPAWWTRRRAWLEHLIAGYEHLGFGKDIVRLVFTAGHPALVANTAFGPEKFQFLQQHLGILPQHALAADPTILRRSLDRLIRPRVLLMLHKEHESCYSFPDIGHLFSMSDAKFCSTMALCSIDAYHAFIEGLCSSSCLTGLKNP
ncbi:hypothetical protein WJX74_004639 [Apatococcus lobatus]|uniref:Uncharacterized protein n=1 Tax=Apatococcus lobatus TaxID=904363 RepID=A0AAW1RVJ7_9CHLO